MEFRVVSQYPECQAWWAPERRFDWQDMRSIILECNRTHTGLVVDTYLVSWSRHVESSFKPTAKKQPGRKQRYLQEIGKERIYHILSENVILYVHASDLRSSGANSFQWEMRILQEGQVHGKRKPSRKVIEFSR